MRRKVKGALALSAVALSIAFSGCGDSKNSDEADKYDVMMDIDQGNYDKAIAALKDGCAGFSQSECNMLLGSVYYAKAGYDLDSMGKDLLEIDSECDNKFATLGYNTAQDCKDTKTTETIFDRLFSDDMKTGIEYYKKVVDSSKCNSNYYDNLTTQQKDACLAINPILLQDTLNEDTKKNSGTVSMEQLIEFKNVLQTAVPELSTQDIVAITQNSSIEGTKSDVNNNNKLDGFDATDCALKFFKDNNSASNCVSEQGLSEETSLKEGLKTDLIFAVQ